jgi:macrodomain Ter protein organizer (MatP/YcbG family)
MYPKEIGWKWVYWVNRALDGDERRVFVNSVIHIQVLQNLEKVTGNIQHPYYECQLLNAVIMKKI